MVRASTDVTVGGVLLSRFTDGIAPNSGDATKIWIDPPDLWIEKVWVAIDPAIAPPVSITVTGPEFPGGVNCDPLSVEGCHFIDIEPGLYHIIEAGPLPDGFVLVGYNPDDDADPTNGTNVTLIAGGMVTVTVTNEAVGSEGCTPGFWRQPQHFGAWTFPYTPEGPLGVFTYRDAFGLGDVVQLKDSKKVVDPTDPTLLEAVQATGGGQNALARHAVAALLNAASDEVAFAFTVDQVIAMVQNAYATGDFNTPKDLLAVVNEAGCTTNGKGDPWWGPIEERPRGRK
jgi:hypothetical protein